MTTESATSSGLPWLWVIEALASFYQVDVVTLYDVVSMAPKFSEIVGKDAREVVALRCLEILIGLGNYMHKDLPSASRSKIGFNSAESCEVVLRRILAEDKGMTGSVASKWDVHSFVSQKRGTLPQIALEQLKNSIVEGTHSFAVNLRKMSGLARRSQYSNRTSADGVDRNEGRGLENICSRSLLSSKRLRDDSAPDFTMQNDGAHLSKRKKSKKKVKFSHTNDKVPPNDGVGCQRRKEALSVCLERDLSPGIVDDVHVSSNRVEQRGDVRVDVPSTAANICDLSGDSQATGFEDMVWQHADEDDGVGCQRSKESLPVCLERDLSPGVVDDVHVSPNRVEQRSDVQVDVPSTSANVRDLSRDAQFVSLENLVWQHADENDGVGCQRRKLPVWLERDLSPGVVDDVHVSPKRVEQRSDVRVDVPSTAANVRDLARDAQFVSLENVVLLHADENDGVGCQRRKLPVCLEKHLSPGVVDDVHVSRNRVEQRSDVRVDAPSTAANVHDLSMESQSVGLEDMVWQHADENDGVGCQRRKSHVCLERDLSPGLVDGAHVSPNRVGQRSDVRVDIPSTAANISEFSGDLNMLPDKVASGNECSVEPHGHPLTASSLKGKEKEISDDDLENDGDGSIPLEGADLFIQFEEPDDFFRNKEPAVCIPPEEPDVHIPSVEPAIHSSRVPHEETNAKPNGDDVCIPLQQPEADSMPRELSKICVALAEPQVAATGGPEKDTDVKDIENDMECNSPGENSSNYDSEEIDVAATKSDFLSSQCNLTEDSLSTADWTEFNFCMKCKMDGQLLRCTSAICPVVVHEICLFSPASIDKEGNFYCPFCAYSHATSVYLEAKRKAFERRKLAAFICGRQSEEHGGLNLVVDIHSNENFKEKAGIQANCGEEHPSRVRNYSIREQEDNKKLQEEPPISGASKNNVSHIIGTSIRGEACGVEYSRVHVPEPVEMVQGHGNQFVAADFVGHETSKDETGKADKKNKDETGKADKKNKDETGKADKKNKDEKGKSAKSRYSTRGQKEKKKYTCPVVPGLRRKTVPWTTEEEKMLMEGLEKLCGTEDQYIRWTEILKYGGTVLRRRTAVDLKDKWRNMCKSLAL